MQRQEIIHTSWIKQDIPGVLEYKDRVTEKSYKL